MHPLRCDARARLGTVSGVRGQSDRPVVRSSRDEPGIPWSSRIPLRTILVGAGIAIAGLAIYLGFRALNRSVDTLSGTLGETAVIGQAVRYLHEHGVDARLPDAYAGRVTDENLSRILRQLAAARDPVVQRAAAELIGLGRVTDVGPIVAMAGTPTGKDVSQMALEAVGPRRLVELAGHPTESARRSAARAICLLSGLTCDEATLRRLIAPASFEERVRTINGICGVWSQGTGSFTVIIAEMSSPTTVRVEQIGRTFLLRAGTAEFRSSLRTGAARFMIPIDQWCAATGACVDAADVRERMSGSVTLAPVVGGAWEGIVRVIARQALSGPLPGFLPLAPLERGRPVEAPIRLVRDARAAGQSRT